MENQFNEEKKPTTTVTTTKKFQIQSKILSTTIQIANDQIVMCVCVCLFQNFIKLKHNISFNEKNNYTNQNKQNKTNKK